MSKAIYITDTTFNDGNTCTRSYYVELKLSSETYYQPLAVNSTQYESPIEVVGLVDDTEYNIRVTRTCCDGTIADPVVVTITTTRLSAPASFAATTFSESQIDLTWDAVSGATRYEVQRGEMADYSDAEVIYDNTTNSYSDTGLTSATTYYYRVRAYSSVKLASDYSTDSATTS